MSPEERQLLQGLFDRMRANATAPRDKDAEQMIADAVRQQTYAPYFLAQTVIVQDQALQAANEKLQQLEQQVKDQQSQSGSGGFLSGIFGGAPSRQPPPPPASRPVWNQGGAPQGGAYPQQGGGYPPPPQQPGGPWGGAQPMGGGGGGFLQGALGTAAGVAGGVLMAESIRSLFTGGHAASGLGIASGVPGMGGGSVVNNYYGDGGASGADARQDAAQDANQDWGGGSNSSPSAADLQQDADQDQDFSQDLDGYDDA